MTDLGTLFEGVRREQDEIRARAGHLARVEERLTSRPTLRRTGRLGWWAVPIAAAALLVALFVVTRSDDLQVHVAGSTDRVPTGVWLGAPAGTKLALDFSDGTKVALAEESEARIVSLSARSVALELKLGHASFEVTKRPGRSFSVHAGPYVVHVTGTRFEVDWAPSEDVFVVRLHEGQVTLSGCGFGAGRQLAAGQTARARCAGSEVSIGYGDSREHSESTHAPPPKPAKRTGQASGALRPGATAATGPVPEAPDTAHPEPAVTWQELSKRGAHPQALAAVEAAGFEKTAAHASARDLMLLADTAERAGQLPRARRALSLLRQRFAGSEEAAYASFALGRLEFDGFGAYPQAASWFRTYLREQPGGPFAREALGRLMEAAQRSGDASEARRLAKRYLHRYPSGPHAELASRLAVAP